MKKTGLSRCIYDFSADYDAIAVDDIIMEIFNGKEQQKIILGFIEKCFSHSSNFFSCSILNVNYLECVSLNNQECKIKSEIINVNTNEHMLYPYKITINKCNDSFNSINNPYAKLCVPDTIKNINVKAFNLVSRTNERRHIEWHKTCKCQCRLNASVCTKKTKME